jgi:protein-serine/threonine kinase
MKHPFIVQMAFAFQEKNKLYIVLEYCPGGELFFYLNQIGRFKEEAAQFYAANILIGLEHLHAHGVLYRDLKPENVLICRDGYTKLTDFGLSKITVSGETCSDKTICGTAEYLSPEILERKCYGQATDWWSYGVMLYEMLVGLPPFYDERRDKMYTNIKEAEPNFEF